jgi:hypothetical protein
MARRSHWFPRRKKRRIPRRRGRRSLAHHLLKPSLKSKRFAPKRFTPLNTRVSKVFMEIRRDPTFRWLAKMKGDPRSCDPTKFCEYHGKNGHFTKDCINLSHEIESFIINGKLV